MNLKKSVLFYFTWQLKPVHHSIIIQELDKVLERKDVENIYFITCGGTLKPCYTNREGDPAVCTLCKFHKNTALKSYKSRIKHIELDDELLQIDRYTDAYEYKSFEDVKKIKYKDCFIGYGALSSYISFTRNLEPEMDADFRTYFNKMLNNQKAVGDFFDRFIQEKEIEELYFFNGRTSNVRPLYDIAKAKKIDFYSLELIMSSDKDYRVNKFKNSLPHDIEYHHQRMMEVWQDPSVEEAEKIKIGASFFENRKNGILTRDRKVFTKDQNRGELPENWDGKKNNIVIFNSSEDEFAAVGDFFEEKALFSSQEKGLEVIFQHFRKDDTLHFYLRVHPNLNDVAYGYHNRIYDLENKYKNVTVVSSSSPISTYTLIDEANKVVGFGSSTGAEACYWGKPVILLAGSFYYYLDIAYKPSSQDESFSLIKNELKPKAKIEAIKYGYYLMNYEKYTLSNRQNPKPLNVLGVQLGLGFDFLKIFNSKRLFKLTEKVFKKSIKTSNKKRYPLPRKEKSNP